MLFPRFFPGCHSGLSVGVPTLGRPSLAILSNSPLNYFPAACCAVFTTLIILFVAMQFYFLSRLIVCKFHEARGLAVLFTSVFPLNVVWHTVVFMDTCCLKRVMISLLTGSHGHIASGRQRMPS